MKKKYIRPQVKLHPIETRQMLCGSPGVNDGYGQPDAPHLGKYDDLDDEEFDW